MQMLEINSIEIEVEYKGKSEDKEAVFEKLKQKIYDDFGCPVLERDLVKEQKEKEAKRKWRAFSNHMFECQFKVKIPDIGEEE